MAKTMYEKDSRPVTVRIKLFIVFIVAPPLCFEVSSFSMIEMICGLF